MIRHLEQRFKYAVRWCAAHMPHVKSFVLTGGVARNQAIRNALQSAATEIDWTVSMNWFFFRSFLVALG